jgi:predicted signal transduction protein with EAL and GGDEF domain
MYAAKQARTGVYVYRPEDDQNTTRRLILMANLRTAIDRGDLESSTNRRWTPDRVGVLGAEALTRWHHVDGTVPPDEFIPLAERSGLIRPLTRHVLHTALASCAD